MNAIGTDSPPSLPAAQPRMDLLTTIGVE